MAENTPANDVPSDHMVPAEAGSNVAPPADAQRVAPDSHEAAAELTGAINEREEAAEADAIEKNGGDSDNDGKKAERAKSSKKAGSTSRSRAAEKDGTADEAAEDAEKKRAKGAKRASCNQCGADYHPDEDDACPKCGVRLKV